MRSPAIVLPAERYFADTAVLAGRLRLDIRVVLVLVFAHGPSPLGAQRKRTDCSTLLQSEYT